MAKHRIMLVDFKEGSGIHCEHASGSDYTLCGDSWDGESITKENPIYLLGNKSDITCSSCLEIIKFCKEL